MDWRGLTDAEMAKQAGCDRSTISRIRRGSQIPKPALMTRIAQVTNSRVGPQDFYGVAA